MDTMKFLGKHKSTLKMDEIKWPSKFDYLTAFSVNNENPDQVVAVQEFQFDEMDEGQDWTIFVNIDTREDNPYYPLIKEVQGIVKVCCKDTSVVKPYILKDMPVPEIVKISCEEAQKMTAEEFHERYGKRRVPVKFEKCGDVSQTMGEKSVENIFGELVKDGEDKPWMTFVHLRQSTQSKKSLSSADVIELLGKGNPIKGVAEIKESQLSKLRESIPESISKTKLMTENREEEQNMKLAFYSKFQGLLPSMFNETWTQTVKGTRKWIFFPSDTPNWLDGINCDLGCSKFSNSFNHLPGWFNHILPQIVRKRFYGEQVRGAVQEAGESLWIPEGTTAAMITINGESIAITKH